MLILLSYFCFSGCYSLFYELKLNKGSMIVRNTIWDLGRINKWLSWQLIERMYDTILYCTCTYKWVESKKISWFSRLVCILKHKNPGPKPQASVWVPALVNHLANPQPLFSGNYLNIFSLATTTTTSSLARSGGQGWVGGGGRSFVKKKKKGSTC